MKTITLRRALQEIRSLVEDERGALDVWGLSARLPAEIVKGIEISQSNMRRASELAAMALRDCEKLR